MNAPRIVCAALLMDDGGLVIGIRHFDTGMRRVISLIYGEKGHSRVKVQGFVDQFGVFYSRNEAWKVAHKNKQIIRPTGFETFASCQPDNLPEEWTLFSENLY